MFLAEENGVFFASAQWLCTPTHKLTYFILLYAFEQNPDLHFLIWSVLSIFYFQSILYVIMYNCFDEWSV